MYTNADITIYFKHGEIYSRQVIKNVFWSDSKQSNVNKTGMTTADAVKIMIPITSADNLVFNTGKDLVVKGEINYEFDNSTPQKISESLRYLNANYDVHTVTISDDKRYGSKNMHHYDLSCK